MYKTLTASRVPHEVARVVLPLSTYTQFVWQMDLHNLLHFLTMQCDKAAQWETRQYAQALKELVHPVCPMALAVLVKCFYNIGG